LGEPRRTLAAFHCGQMAGADETDRAPQKELRQPGREVSKKFCPCNSKLVASARGSDRTKVNRAKG
jgi:hypothetical protein